MDESVIKCAEIIIFHRRDVEKNTVKSVLFPSLRDFFRDRSRRIDPRMRHGAAFVREKRCAARGGGWSRMKNLFINRCLTFVYIYDIILEAIFCAYDMLCAHTASVQWNWRNQIS